MPYASEAQRRWAHSPSGEKALGKSGVKEWDSATRGKKLPEKAAAMSDGKGKEYADMVIKHEEHGKDGSHQDSHKMVGGARSRIMTGSPSELEAFHGGSKK